MECLFILKEGSSIVLTGMIQPFVGLFLNKNLVS